MAYVLRNYAAAIFDLDGVLTTTESVHFLAWKKLFDELIQYSGSGQREFSNEEYRDLIDGIPRIEGIRSFLRSRNLELPEGDDKDSAGYHSIAALSLKKNEYFLEFLSEKGIELYRDAIGFLHLLKDNDFSLALISSSKNAAEILKETGLLSSFSAVVTGGDLEEKSLKGKPHPDSLLEASRRISVEPAETIVIEDAISGVEAAVSGGYGLIIGLARRGDKATLLQHGASIAEVSFPDIRQRNYFLDYKNIPSAFEILDSVSRRQKESSPVLFLDYDGTLTPIVKRPEEAILSDDVRQLLKKLSVLIPVAVVSGRDLRSIRELVGIEGIYYSGSHGFEISGPGGVSMQHEEAVSHLDELRSLGESLKEQLSEIPGSQVELKSFGIGCHYRNVSKDDSSRFLNILEGELKKYKNLSVKKGKRVVDIKPDVAWDKGRAVYWLLENLNSSSSSWLPIYIGDDLTDEDAFQALKGEGKTIYVGDADSITCADYYLKDSSQVEVFLRKLLSCLSME